MFGTVPLIEDFLDEIFVIVQLKAQRRLVGFMTGVALDVQPHTHIVAYNRRSLPERAEVAHGLAEIRR